MSGLKLLEPDARFLAEKEYEYELFSVTNEVHIVIKGFHFPSEYYTPSQADVLIKIPTGYPNTQLDMFWVSPEVKLVNGQIPKQTESRETNHGREWQRWSRHYTSPWRPGVDNLRSFIQSIHVELRKGI